MEDIIRRQNMQKIGFPGGETVTNGQEIIRREGGRLQNKRKPPWAERRDKGSQASSDNINEETNGICLGLWNI